MKKSIFFGLIISIMILLTGCSGSWVIINGFTYNTPTKISMRYDRFDGYKTKTLDVEAGETVVVSVKVVTNSGLLDAFIAKDNNTNDCSYQGNDIPTSSFTVNLTSEGKYTIRVDADNHSGSFSFEWE